MMWTWKEVNGTPIIRKTMRFETENKTRQVEGGEVLEPYVGMGFESEDDARRFYTDYARRVGFVVRIMQGRRSEIDGSTLARRLCCNKQGISPKPKGRTGQERKPGLRDKDKKIHELTGELQRQEEISAAYRERFINLLADIEKQADHLSPKVLAVVQHVKKAEAEAMVFSRA
ncbi:hypothetical protein DH2020_006942 [Rehmannia glutinosa]|uniref:FAR1 domain-containing protein n=1 Tax=Rehmannia glutinosa TaxID=99300 RepID=A0ABR0XKV5_REHGL